MSDTIKLICAIAYAIICAIASLLFIHYFESSAQEEVNKARIEAETAKVAFETVNGENEKLREMMLKANEAVSRVLNIIEESQVKHEERIQTIENDPAAADWLVCDLPDSVRDAFRDYCADGHD